MFKMKQPIHFTPSRDILIHKYPMIQRVLDILETDLGAAFAITSPNMFYCFTNTATIPPSPHHVLDILTLNTHGEMLLCSVCKIEGSTTEQQDQVTYVKVLARLIKNKLLNVLSERRVGFIVHIHISCKLYRLTSSDHVQSSPTFIQEAFRSTSANVDVIRMGIAYLLLQKRGYLYNAVGEEISFHYSPVQIAVTLECTQYPISIITGAPGTGKSLVLQELCWRNGKEKSLYVCSKPALAERVCYQQKADVLCVKDCQSIVEYLLHDQQYKDRTLIAIDDAQCLSWDKRSLLQLCQVESKSLAFCLDSNFHNYREDDKSKELVKFLVNHCNEVHNMSPYQKTLIDIYRNSEVVGSYMQSGFTAQRGMVNKATVPGDDVRVTVVEKLYTMDETNGIINHIKKMCVGCDAVYKPEDIAILVNRRTPKDTEATVKVLLRLFQKHYPDGKQQRVTPYPVRGVVIESLEGFIGIDSKVVLSPVWKESEEMLTKPKYRCAVSSRGVMYVEFLQQKVDSEVAIQHGLDRVPAGYDQDHR
jgi:hypothetical protein